MISNDPIHENRHKTIQQMFEEFHEQNPWVYDEFVKLTREAKEHGATKVGIGMFAEVVRWKRFKATNDYNSGFKINNSYRSRYVRLIMEREPDLKDIFEIRELKTS